MAGVHSRGRDHEAGHAHRLYDVLAPYGDFNVMAHPECSLGAAARYLGVLAATMSSWQEAAAHFEQALTMNARMGVGHGSPTPATTMAQCC
jgi:hypothetical protein